MEGSLQSLSSNRVAIVRFLTAIIRRAVLDFALYKDSDPETHPKQHALAVDAADWLFLDSTETMDEEGRFTFLYTCSLLDLHPRTIRAKALDLTREDIQLFNGRY